jgi:hypothetical protein
MNDIANAIGKSWITFPCPKCGLENDCYLLQVTLGETVLCRGCHMSLNLVDKDASTHTATSQIERALSDLQDVLSKL